MNYNYIKCKNIHEYNTIPEYEIISDNSSINSKVFDTNSDDITFKNDISDNNDIWWPIKVKYGGKSLFPMTKINYLINKNCKIIRYYYVNHNLNTKNKKLIMDKLILIALKKNFI